MLGLRKLDGIDENLFKTKFGLKINEIFNMKPLIDKGLIIENNYKIFIPEKYLFVSNDIIVNLLMGGDLDDRE